MPELYCHPATPCPAVASLQASVTCTADGGLHLCYHLRGDLAQVRIPAPQAPLFTDGLWEHTCFEAFVGVAGNSAYHEFNFSPSGQWAAYAFSDYRQRVEWVGKSSGFPLLQRGNPEDFLLQAPIPIDNLPVGSPLQLNLTAVIELLDGSKSYWALKHPTERPDFHHRDGFTHEIWP